ncbi:MAG: FkbM family methyltransferase [Proteobacteria bacterium]|nr:MAG: FkbM family methyltransferase [Pseudomonadota bacterium]
MIPTLYNLLDPNRLTEIVDIGANLVDGDPPYKPMLASGLCKVTGFEPQEVALLQLNSRKSPNERYLPYAIGDGDKHTLKICQTSGMTSLLTPNTTMLDLFEPFTEFGKIISEVPLKTKRLDDISEIRHIDFLKIDIQGGELSVFQHGNAKLNQCVAIQTEVSFMPLYEGQPTIGDIDSEMRSMGFVPHHLAELKRWAIKEDVRYKPNQLLEADIVFVRNYSKPDNLSEEQLKHLALIAHYCYHSCDLALFCISILEERGKLEPGTRQQYKDFVNES